MSEVINQKIPVAERIAFIEESNQLINSQLMRARSFSISPKAELPIDKDELNAAIMGAGIVGFDPSMNKRNKRIVKNTYMYADIKSLLKYPAESQKELRYKEFMQTMRHLGWFVFTDAYTKYSASSQSLTMDNVALDLIHTVVGGVTGGLVGKELFGKAADAALKALKTEPEALKLFENNVKKPEGGNFAMASCKQDVDGEITMAVGAVQYACKVHPTKVLFWDWSSSEVEIYNGSSVMSMDEEDYQMIEPLVLKALAEQREKALTLEFGAAASGA